MKSIRVRIDGVLIAVAPDVAATIRRLRRKYGAELFLSINRPGIIHGTIYGREILRYNSLL